MRSLAAKSLKGLRRRFMNHEIHEPHETDSQDRFRVFHGNHLSHLATALGERVWT